jgi:hypothetical protein
VPQFTSAPLSEDRFAEAEGSTLLAEFVEAESGKGADALDRRPQLAAALAAARQRKCPVIVAKLNPAGWTSTLIATSTGQYSDSGHGTTCDNWVPRLTCRWGDYSATQIDPDNPNQAWGFNQLITGTSQFDWVTKAGKIN